MKKALIALFILTFLCAKAQVPDNAGGGTISGRVVDSATKQPVLYASVGLVNQQTAAVIDGTVTNDKGEFKLANVKDGTYKLLVTFIGYATSERDNVTVDKAATVKVGDILLPSLQKTLNAVTVTADKNLIENKIDKLVYNVEQDVTSQTGVASDVLQKVPGVSLDVDGNVSLLGNPSVSFLINGKPSVVFGSNIVDVLQSIPASQIDKIEIITTPGAKYDANGTGGIINIILKKSTAEGVHGDLSLSGGTRLENGSFNLNAHHKHISANAFVSGNAQLQSTTPSSYNLTSASSILNEAGSSLFNRQGAQAGLGIEWDATSKDNLSASLGYNYYGNKNTGLNNRSTETIDSVGNSSTLNDQVNTASNFHLNSFDWQINYKRKFKKEDQELELSYQSSQANNFTYYMQSQQYVNPEQVYSGSYGNNPGTEKDSYFTADYTEPFGENTILEAGAKLSIMQVNSESDVYLFQTPSDVYGYNSTQSYSLTYTSYVYAGYASLKFKLFNYLDIKGGLRYEYTMPNAYFSNAGNVNVASYGSYVPSIILSHTFKNHQTLKVGYSRRIQRPDYRDLNPFVNASDPKNLSTGNPQLQPEIGDKIELNYSKTFESGANINATLFYRSNTNDIQPYTAFYSSYVVGDSIYKNVSVTAWQNVGREDNFGLNFFCSIPITSHLNFRTNLSGFQRYIYPGTLGASTIQGFNYRTTGTLTYTIKTIIIELFGNFNSPRINIEGTFPAFITYNAAIRKTFFDKKLSIAITATNFINEYMKQETKLTGLNFTSDNIRDLPYRSFGINLTYKFGKLKFKNDKETVDPNLSGSQEGN